MEGCANGNGTVSRGDDFVRSELFTSLCRRFPRIESALHARYPGPHFAHGSSRGVVYFYSINSVISGEIFADFDIARAGQLKVERREWLRQQIFPSLLPWLFSGRGHTRRRQSRRHVAVQPFRPGIPRSDKRQGAAPGREPGWYGDDHAGRRNLFGRDIRGYGSGAGRW